MTNTTEALNAAWAHLWWLTDDEAHPNRYRTALDLFADPIIRQRAAERVKDRILSRGGDPETADRRSIGGHGDPTANAAIGDAADELLRNEHTEMVGLERLIAESAGWIRQQTQQIHYDAFTELGSFTLRQAAADVVYCCTAPHTTERASTILRQLDRTEARRELLHAVDLLYRQCRTLQSLVLGHLERAVRPPSEKPRQPKINECRCHARHGWPAVIADSTRNRNLCSRCANFRTNHGCDPTAPILKRWDYGQGPTPGQIIEAKAQAKPRKKATG